MEAEAGAAAEPSAASGLSAWRDAQLAGESFISAVNSVPDDGQPAAVAGAQPLPPPPPAAAAAAAEAGSPLRASPEVRGALRCLQCVATVHSRLLSVSELPCMQCESRRLPPMHSVRPSARLLPRRRHRPAARWHRQAPSPQCPASCAASSSAATSCGSCLACRPQRCSCSAAVVVPLRGVC